MKEEETKEECELKVYNEKCKWAYKELCELNKLEADERGLRVFTQATSEISAQLPVSEGTKPIKPRPEQVALAYLCIKATT